MIYYYILTRTSWRPQRYYFVKISVRCDIPSGSSVLINILKVYDKAIMPQRSYLDLFYICPEGCFGEAPVAQLIMIFFIAMFFSSKKGVKCALCKQNIIFCLHNETEISTTYIFLQIVTIYNLCT